MGLGFPERPLGVFAHIKFSVSPPGRSDPAPQTGEKTPFVELPVLPVGYLIAMSYGVPMADPLVDRPTQPKEERLHVISA